MSWLSKFRKIAEPTPDTLFELESNQFASGSKSAEPYHVWIWQGFADDKPPIRFEDTVQLSEYLLLVWNLTERPHQIHSVKIVSWIWEVLCIPASGRDIGDTFILCSLHCMIEHSLLTVWRSELDKACTLLPLRASSPKNGTS